VKRLLLVLAVGGILLLALTLIAGSREALLSAQVGYWSAVLVVLASFGSYRRMVRARLEAGAIPANGSDRDTLEKIEDPFDLYGEEDEPAEEERKPLKEIVREEKARMKKQRRSPLATARDAAPAFSLWRLGAYGVLVLGFFLLRDNHWLHLGAYLGSLALPIALAVWSLMTTEGPHGSEA
jgi:hypothetical protein